LGFLALEAAPSKIENNGEETMASLAPMLLSGAMAVTVLAFALPSPAMSQKQGGTLRVSTRILAFAAGEFDLTQTADITPPLLKDLQKSAPSAACSMLPTNVTTHMLVNRERTPFDNPELRRAMLLSLDRQAFIDILTLGKGKLAVNMMPPPEGSWGMPIEELQKLPSYGDPVVQREAARK
jgi:ABC-type transport system substrate-binding protein